MRWLVWPIEGTSIRIVRSFGRWAVSSADPNWRLEQG